MTTNNTIPLLIRNKEAVQVGVTLSSSHRRCEPWLLSTGFLSLPEAAVFLLDVPGKVLRQVCFVFGFSLVSFHTPHENTMTNEKHPGIKYEMIHPGSKE